jgi:hypothetical protein
VDSEYKLAEEVYLRVLYADTSAAKDEYFRQYVKIVDQKRDYNLKQCSDITFQCLDRHSKMVRHHDQDVAACRELEKKQIKFHETNSKLHRENETLTAQLRRAVENNTQREKTYRNKRSARVTTNTTSIFVGSSDSDENPPPPKKQKQKT